jgi:ribosomal protein L11 methyltransferase
MTTTWRVLLRVPAVWVPPFQEAVEETADGIAAFELPDQRTWLIEALYVAPPPEDEIAERVRQTAAGLGLPTPALTVEALPDIDWVSHTQRLLSPVAAGRFLVHGSHDRGRAPAGAIALEIEAGRAFGTGHHETTRGCLLTLDRLSRLARRPRRPLDLGTGSGVLAIAIARAWQMPVVAVDIDPVSVTTAAENARINRAAALVRPRVADGVDATVRAGGPYDLVIANILARPLVRMATPIARVTAPGGRLVLAGLLAHQETEVLAAYRARGFRLERRLRLGDWPTLLLRRRASVPAAARA